MFGVTTPIPAKPGTMTTIDDPRRFLTDLFNAAIETADPSHCLPQFLPKPPRGRTIVIGAGKAGGAMAKAVEENYDGAIEGLVVTRYGHGTECRKIEIVEAAHPVPDARGLEAARRIRAMVDGLSEDDLVLCLISGGGSALLTMPGEGRGPDGKIVLTLDDKQAINKELLWCGAPIDEMNTVRKHLSAIKGGRLAVAAYPAQVVTLAISDVPGDDPAVIASGPTVADSSTVEDARAVLAKYDIAVPAHINAFLDLPEADTAKAGDPRLARSSFELIARPQASLEAAAEICNRAGIRPIILGDAIEGEARDVAREQTALARSHLEQGDAVALISGGETTVTVTGNGRGGRNAEFLLAFAIATDGAAGIHALAGDTDGIDGSEDNAGAYTGPNSLSLAREKGLDPQALLENNDGYGFFDAIDGLIKTGPTLTNVNDFRAVLVLPE
ncbi:MAG: glycerate kinase type-2 family protein [Hyphomicrobiaceae bacterium]